MTVRTRQIERVVARLAFTLMEMLVVVAIIVALAGIGGFFLFGQLQNSKQGVARAKIRNLDGAVQIYMTNNGVAPASLDALFQPDPANRPPILRNIQDKYDPWGNEFVYNPVGTNTGGMPEIYCVVPDSGGQNIIGNWQ
jgi:general secretion pathway protein G